MRDIPRLIRKYNPLGAVRLLLSILGKVLSKLGLGTGVISSLNNRLLRYQLQLDFKEFDQARGTDTGCVIPLGELTVNSSNTNEGLWYEGLSPRIFQQFMRNLRIPFSNFDFIDFGSGKGRVLLMAAEQGFRKCIGVEFALEIHKTAGKNTAIFNRDRTPPVDFELHHLDAVDYVLPESPLVIFFYCPFRGQVLDRVLSNIKMSCRRYPRPVIMLFYGQNPVVIQQFKSMGFSCREILLKRDWTRFIHYRGYIFTATEVS